jgi:hypothetical protein
MYKGRFAIFRPLFIHRKGRVTSLPLSPAPCYTWFLFQYLMTTFVFVSFSSISSWLAGPTACVSSKSELVHVLRKEKRGENFNLDLCLCGTVTHFLQLVSILLFNDDLRLCLFLSISSWLAGPRSCASSKSALVHVLRKEKRV